MGTALIYLLVVVVVAAVVYALAVAVFGRGEELPPLPEGETPTRLPVGRVSGADVRALRIPQAVRGYRMVEVDWVLDRLAGEVERLGAERDELAARLRAVGDPAPAGDGDVADTPTGGWVLPGGERPPGRHSRTADVAPERETGPAADAVPGAVTAPGTDAGGDTDPDTSATAWPPQPPADPAERTDTAVDGKADGSSVGVGGRRHGLHRAQEQA
jgi:DivIVA domain-containing protein